MTASLAALGDVGIHLPAACGGRGTCGQCRVTIRVGGDAPAPVEVSLVSRAEYARNTRYATAAAPSLEEAVTRYQMTADRFHEVAAYCRSAGVTFFSSCFAPAEVDLLGRRMLRSETATLLVEPYDSGFVGSGQDIGIIA